MAWLVRACGGGAAISSAEASALTRNWFYWWSATDGRHVGYESWLERDWSRKMDGIDATIWASQTTLPLEPDVRLNLAASRARTGSASPARPAAEIAD
jgi:hypothetical protein